MYFEFDDGGRKRPSLDCVARAIAIVLDVPYSDVCRGLNREAIRQGTPCFASSGVRFSVYSAYLKRRGWLYSPVIFVRKTKTSERATVRQAVPVVGRYVVRSRKHLLAVIEGCVRDTFDSRDFEAFGMFIKTQRQSQKKFLRKD